MMKYCLAWEDLAMCSSGYMARHENTGQFVVDMTKI